jgi:glycosyltransferase involved in cell wall biosynthesis
MPSRVIFLTERFPDDIGGVARSAGRLCRNLSELGIAVEVIAWSRFLRPGEVVGPAPADRIPVYRVGLYRHWDMTFIHTLNLLDRLRQKHDRPLVWGHYLFPAGFLAVWFARLNGLKSIVNARGNDIDRSVFLDPDFARSRWTLEKADRITAVSEDIARKMRVFCDREDVYLLKNAVDTDIFYPSSTEAEKTLLRDSLQIPPDTLVLGFSGELREKKGQSFLLPCLEKVGEVRDARLLIVGQTRDDTEIGHDRRVTITGHLDDPSQISRHLQICDIFLQPSLWEGLPNALLEAMACGRLCLASDAGEIPEIIRSGVNGFILPRYQLPYLGEAVLELINLEDPEKNRIRERARETIRADFSLAAEKRRIQEIIGDLQ